MAEVIKLGYELDVPGTDLTYIITTIETSRNKVTITGMEKSEYQKSITMPHYLSEPTGSEHYP